MQKAQLNTTVALIILLVIMILASVIAYNFWGVQRTVSQTALCQTAVTKSFLGTSLSESKVANFFSRASYKIDCKAPVRYIEKKEIEAISKVQEARYIAQNLITADELKQQSKKSEFLIAKTVADDIHRCWEIIGDKNVFDETFKIASQYAEGKRDDSFMATLRWGGGTLPPIFCIACAKYITEPNPVLTETIDVSSVLKKMQTKKDTILFEEIQKGILKTTPDYEFDTTQPQTLVYYRQYPFAPDEQGVRKTEGYGYKILNVQDVVKSCDLLANSYGDIS